MLKNYLKIAIRNFKKNKIYSLINVLGLSLGITCSLLIFILIRYEISFDTFHQNADRIYRIVTNSLRQEGSDYNPGAPFPLHGALENDFPQLDHIAILRHDDDGLITIHKGRGDTGLKLKEEHIGFADDDFLEIFQYDWLAGNPKNALKTPNTVVLTKGISEKYFGRTENALGQVIRWNNQYDLKVTGVIEDVPVNTDFPLNMIVSIATIEDKANKDWGTYSSSMQHLVLLPETYPARQFQHDLEIMKHKYLDERDDRLMSFLLQPLSKIHFDSRYGNFNDKVISIEVIWSLVAIALFLILTACINFINLATAQAVKRSREVGVRKVMGGTRRQLTVQFLYETFFITLLAVIIAVGLTEMALPAVNRALGVNLGIGLLKDPAVFVYLAAVTVVVSLFSGVFPALVLAGFNPVQAIKNSISAKSNRGFTLRRSLVVLQFVISQILIIGTIVVSSQLAYFKNADLGFQKEAILTLPLPENDENSLERLRSRLSAIPGIQNITFSLGSPSSDGRWVYNFNLTGSGVEDFHADVKFADTHYLETYGLELLEGRMFTESDTMREVIVNETLLKKFGIKNPGQILGRELLLGSDIYLPIVGVIKDFHSSSLKEEIPPLIITTRRNIYEEAGVKLQSANISRTLDEIQAAWNDVFPAYVFDFEFLDATIAEFYERETRLSQLFRIFAGIAIFIGCLGLYGLVSFMSVQKSKEVGIRKIMGASAYSILMLFSKEFTRLVLIAFVIAAPVAYLIMDNWLNDFTYRIEPGVGIFLVAIITSLVIAWLTVGFKVIKAALANPVDALKNE